MFTTAFYLTDDKQHDLVATPTKCPHYNNKPCSLKTSRWKSLVHPVLDNQGIYFVQNIQWHCETHDKLCSLGANTCKLPKNSTTTIKCHKIGDYRITDDFLQTVSLFHQQTANFDVPKTLEFVYNHYSSMNRCISSH